MADDITQLDADSPSVADSADHDKSAACTDVSSYVVATNINSDGYAECIGDTNIDSPSFVAVPLMGSLIMETFVPMDQHPLVVVPVDGSDDANCAELSLLNASNDNSATTAHDVPDVVAAETVVTTVTPARQRRKQAFFNVMRGDRIYYEGLNADAVQVTTSPDDSNNSAEFSIIHVEGSDVVTIVPTDAEHSSPSSWQPASATRNHRKLEQDRQKKRELRQDADFRERERIKARARMKQRRCDPKYRDAERQKDKWRRRVARKQDSETRQRERLRDNVYKQRQRDLNLNRSTQRDCTQSVYISTVELTLG